MNEESEVKLGSGNVFADLELPDAEERLAKAMLSRLITVAIREHRWTQAEAADVLGTTQPKVSDIVRGQVRSFTIDRLIKYLTLLHRNVHIVVSPAPDGEAGTLIVDEAAPVPAHPSPRPRRARASQHAS